MKLEQYLAAGMNGVGKVAAREIIAEGRVLVDGEKVTVPWFQVGGHNYH